MTRFRFAEQFGVNPDAVGRVSLRTWHRWQAWETARAYRAALDRIESVGFEKASAEDRQMYNDVAFGRFKL